MPATSPSEISAERARRDLIWCLNSPGLVADGADHTIWPSDAWYEQLQGIIGDALPQPGHRHHFRLGQHFEQSLKYWLNEQIDYSLLAANLQVHDKKRTVGEFDFLVSHQNVTQHWEAAVKFYLGTGDCTQMSNWYGPNTADRLDIKYDRLIAHQLVLANNPPAAKLLADRHIAVDESLCFMKGRLFYPHEMFVSNRLEYPPVVNATHERGWWIPAEQFSDAFDNRHRYVHLEKLFWLSALQQDIDGVSLGEMSSYLTSGREPATLIAVLDQDGLEQSRGFVVDDRWQDTVDQNQSGNTSTG